MQFKDRARVTAYVALVQSAERVHSQVTAGLSDTGLTATQFSTLKVLRKHGAMPQRDVAEYILRTEGNMTYVIDQLEARNFVVRERVASDRRQYLVRLTAEGEAFFDNFYPEHTQNIETAMGALTSEECATLSEILGKIELAKADTTPICVSP
jgi:MarR family transcriptional regulator, 2-MHQ and catechol-resistance regulon repressor